MSFSEIRDRTRELNDPIREALLLPKGKPVAVMVGIDAWRSFRALLDRAQDPERW